MNSKSTISSTQNETGAQLFARLLANTQSQAAESDTTTTKLAAKMESIIFNQNKKLNIDLKILPDGIENKEIIEICGRYSLGKTELIMHLMSRLLLPPKWKIDINTNDSSSSSSSLNRADTTNKIDTTIQIDLSEYSCWSNENNTENFFKNAQHIEPSQMPKVILIETEMKFNLLRLFTILENRLTKSFNQFLNKSQKDSKLKISQIQNSMNKFIKECLKNLIVFKCCTSNEFILALSSCEHYIQSLNQTNKQNASSMDGVIIPVFIDTINSNYEINDKYYQSLGVYTESNYTENFTVVLIKRLIERNNVCIIASRNDMSVDTELDSSFRAQYSNFIYHHYKKWQSILSKRIEITMKSNDDVTLKNDEEAGCDQEDQQPVIDQHEPIQNLPKQKLLKLYKLNSNSNQDPNASKPSLCTNETNQYVDSSKILIQSLSYSIENIGFTILPSEI